MASREATCSERKKRTFPLSLAEKKREKLWQKPYRVCRSAVRERERAAHTDSVPRVTVSCARSMCVVCCVCVGVMLCVVWWCGGVVLWCCGVVEVVLGVIVVVGGGVVIVVVSDAVAQHMSMSTPARMNVSYKLPMSSHLGVNSWRLRHP